MTRLEVINWFKKKLNRNPEANDFYTAAKDLYQLGSYSRSLLCLKEYVTISNNAAPGHHLMGYCYLNLGETENALLEFKNSIEYGYSEDWQLIVELTIELDEQKRKY
ncbi:hypothetical protein BCR32DRAFT_198205 [Anaeromyces robustus]|uniref:Uncharacterized protein n=1 Tax=Anaeromyces robustus TaxID=1754192 RepID=A0A1Y1XNV3_9FUNG|nr:hypothetical protein BCR32DRAFT_198205 [Anaeromyces robustus]|eukprot:ORX87206.1 hypothetical protein BCR32DRAFT_198205 [Anaeromyces robustus]